ncbi:unnamed protein product [Amoebophrya sp. A25]|nr:unnamed protein product [Amoebophrya sp. A25]|eukprot:GSA25T00024558001.1
MQIFAATFHASPPHLLFLCETEAHFCRVLGRRSRGGDIDFACERTERQNADPGNYFIRSESHSIFLHIISRGWSQAATLWVDMVLKEATELKRAWDNEPRQRTGGRQALRVWCRRILDASDVEGAMRDVHTAKYVKRKDLRKCLEDLKTARNLLLAMEFEAENGQSVSGSPGGGVAVSGQGFSGKLSFDEDADF